MGWGLRPRPLGFTGSSAMNSAQDDLPPKNWSSNRLVKWSW